ncbi:YqgE/AlgH family protein [Phenylobacterium sp.]|jgi:putative transcriptional regulator|uniref:YqgE/AlgH family protein n=1 Tax=Phenylobacterium sp. TaxID=1871053 RepID=UPI002FDA18F0
MSEHEPTLEDPGGYLSGQLLIAMPGIGDPRFERAVVLICAHDEDHAMGLAVNRPLDGLMLSDLLDRLSITPQSSASSALDEPVLLGGPVERERGFVLHTDDYHSENSLSVAPGMALTATREVLERLAHGEGPRRSLMALGYAGWGAGQLEREIRENVWLTCPADEALLFGDDHDHKWSQALAKIGVDPGFLSASAGQA